MAIGPDPDPAERASMTLKELLLLNRSYRRFHVDRPCWRDDEDMHHVPKRAGRSSTARDYCSKYGRWVRM